MSLGDDTLSGTLQPEALLGQRIDDYDIESIVGTGAMGIVYRGVHHLIGKRVAIKVLKASFADDAEMKNRVIKEARTVNAIKHPSIVDVFGFGTLPTGQPYIVMDLLEGEPLDAWVDREAPMTLKQAGPVLEELLSALAAAHHVGVIHRDIKPGNIFLEVSDEDGLTMKLLDFGLAGLADRANGSIKPTNPGSVVGTPAFMAPEQILAQKMTPATDLYAVGGIAWQMFTGRLPFESANAWEMLNQKLTTDAPSMKPLNSKVDSELDKWVLSLLARDPLKRPASAEEARRQLRSLMEARVSGNFASLQTRGVVPKRVWQEARTEAVIPVSDETQPPGLSKATGESTLDDDNPFAKTHMREGLKTGELEVEQGDAGDETSDDEAADAGAAQHPEAQLDDEDINTQVGAGLRGSGPKVMVVVAIVVLVVAAVAVALSQS